MLESLYSRMSKKMSQKPNEARKTGFVRCVERWKKIFGVYYFNLICATNINISSMSTHAVQTWWAYLRTMCHNAEHVGAWCAGIVSRMTHSEQVGTVYRITLDIAILLDEHRSGCLICCHGTWLIRTRSSYSSFWWTDSRQKLHRGRSCMPW